MKVVAYNPQSEIGDLRGKIILITGGTAGLGSKTIELLAAQNPSHIYFTGRNEGSANKLIDSLKTSSPKVVVSFLPCDLTALASVKSAAEKFQSQSKSLDILICNAGIMATPPGLTKDGYEIQFGTNHLGHALLIKKLLPTLKTSTDPRCIILSSEGHRIQKSIGIAFDELKTTQDSGFAASWYRYAQSKLANVLYARSLAQHEPSVTSVSIHPGVITENGLVQNLGFVARNFVKLTTIGQGITAEQGAYNTCWAATSSREGIENGAYYIPVGEKQTPGGRGTDDGLAAELWKWTDEQLATCM